jgi:hypothetical protein
MRQVGGRKHGAAFHSWYNHVFYSFSTVNMSNGSINCNFTGLMRPQKRKSMGVNFGNLESWKIRNYKQAV